MNIVQKIQSFTYLWKWFSFTKLFDTLNKKARSHGLSKTYSEGQKKRRWDKTQTENYEYVWRVTQKNLDRSNSKSKTNWIKMSRPNRRLKNKLMKLMEEDSHLDIPWEKN